MSIRGLCKLPDGRDWRGAGGRGKVGGGGGTGSCLEGRAVLSKTLIQLSADGWGCTPSLLVWPEVTQSWSLLASIVGLLVTSKRTYSKTHLGLLLPVPLSPWGSTVNPYPQTLTGRSVSVSCGSLTLFLGSWCTQAFVCALQEWSLCFHQSHEAPVIKSLWPSKSASLGISSPLTRIPES